MLKIVSKGKAERKTLMQIWNAVLPGCNELLATFQRRSGRPVEEVDFSKRDASFELNQLFINMRVDEKC